MGQTDLEVIDFLRVLLNNENGGVCSGERKVHMDLLWAFQASEVLFQSLIINHPHF